MERNFKFIDKVGLTPFAEETILNAIKDSGMEPKESVVAVGVGVDKLYLTIDGEDVSYSHGVFTKGDRLAKTKAGLDMHCTFFQQSDMMMEMLRDIPCIDSVTGFRTIKPGMVNMREAVWNFKAFRRLERDSDEFKAFVTVTKEHYFEVFDDEENSWVYEFSDDGDASHVLTIGLFMNWR